MGLVLAMWVGAYLGRRTGPWFAADWIGVWMFGSLTVLFAALAFNRTEVRLTRQELSIRTAPVAVFPAQRIALAEIAEIYFWRQVVPTRTVPRVQWAVNARRKRGHDIALIAEFSTVEEAARAAAKLGEFAGVPHGALTGAPGRDWTLYRRMMAVIAWFVLGPVVLTLLLPR